MAATKEATRVQVELALGNRRRMCWVENDARVAVGRHITLKGSEDPGKRWEVLWVSEPRAAASINRGWQNDI